MSRQASPGQDVADLVGEQVRELFRRAAALAAGLAEESGVHPTDLRALRALDAARETPLTVGELGARLGLSSAAVSGLVDRLEAADLARRTPDPRDRRRVLVELTETATAFGQQRLVPISGAVQRAIAATDPAELVAVHRFLAALLDPDGS